jgi:hypothetical protein
VFPVRYELNSYILLRPNSVFKGLICSKQHGDEVEILTGYQFMRCIETENSFLKLTAFGGGARGSVVC